MYPSQRNRQPTFFGRSERVSTADGQSFTEIHYLRKAVEAACIRTGALYAHWRRMTPGWNDGYCPRCNSTFRDGGIDPDCYVCYGIGFEGGYTRPTVQWMLIQNQNEYLERTELGFLIQRRSESLSPYVPELHTGDLIGRLVWNQRTKAWETQERFVISGNVRPARVRETTEVVTKNTEDHLDPYPEVAGYMFFASMINRHDDVDRLAVEYQVPFDNPLWLADINERTR